MLILEDCDERAWTNLEGGKNPGIDNILSRGNLKKNNRKKICVEQSIVEWVSFKHWIEEGGREHSHLLGLTRVIGWEK